MKTMQSVSDVLPRQSATSTFQGQISSAKHGARFKRMLFWFGLALMLVANRAQAQFLDCSCLATQAVLFTNGCNGVIPDLCTVVSNCWFPSVSSTGFTCSQFPPPGTPVSSATPITFTLFDQPSNTPYTCNPTYYVGASTNRFTVLCQPNFTVPCGTTSWSFPAPGWTNTCCTGGMITNVSYTTNWPTICANWIIQDGCGLVDFCSQCVTFVGPCVTNCLQVFCSPTIITQTCLAPSTAGIPGGTTNISFPPPTVINNCPGVVTNVFCTPPSGSPFPVGTNTVICCAEDNLGNSNCCSFDVIVLGDTTPPVVTCGPNQTVQCGTSWLPIPPTAVDACCPPGSLTIMLFGSVTNSTPPCLETIEYWWHVMDCNGNYDNCTNTVTIVDTTPPVIICNSNQTYSCGNTAGGPGGWTPTPPAATDNCCPAVTVSLVSMITNVAGICTNDYTLVWAAQDCCTNISYCTETVSVIDTNPPFLFCAGPKTVECGSGWTYDLPTAIDSCCGSNVSIITLSNNVIISGLCLNITDQYWIAVDCCSNFSAVCSQRVVEQDTTPPVMTCASNLTINCGFPVVFTPPTAVDACCPPAGVTVVVSSTITNSLSPCPEIITRTWTATDCCGNSTNCSQTITVVDNVPPVITCPLNQTIQCGSPFPTLAATATDNCCNASGISVFISGMSTNTPSFCQDDIAVVWEAVDCCGNKSFCTNFVTVIDTIPPIITCASGIVPVQCGNPIIPPPATDGCCTNLLVTVINAVTNFVNPCRYFVTNTWQAMDCCSNVATCVETVDVSDFTPPIITCGPNITVQCGTPWSFATPTAFDNCCGTNVTIISFGILTNVVGCTTTVSQTWQAMDCCNNFANCSQIITIVDTVPPVISGVSNSTVQCQLFIGGLPWPGVTAIDACCGTNVTIAVVSTTSVGNCPNVNTRVYSATDCCGNVSFFTQVLTIVDTIPPTLGCGPNFTVGSQTPWNFSTPISGDSCCPGGIFVVSTVTNVVSPCLKNITRNWIAYDCCSNSATCSQTVTVTNVPPPNDPCTSPIALVLNGAYICGSNICATPTPAANFNIIPCGSSVNAPDVWYTVTAACNGALYVDTCQPCSPNPTFDTVLSAYTGPCNALIEVPVPSPNPGGLYTSCNDDYWPTCGLRSRIVLNAVAGQTYRIRVSGFAGAIGYFSIRATQTVAPPPNDLCVNAQVVFPGNPAACGTTGGTGSCAATPTPAGNLFPGPCGLSAGSPDVWYAFTPQCPGTYRVDTCFTCPPKGTFDTVLSIYTGTCPGPLWQVAGTPAGCNDDSGPYGNCQWTLQSFVEFTATAGTTYYIRVAGYNNSAGDFRLNINQVIAPPANNNCVNATPVGVGTHAWSTCGATLDGPAGPCNPNPDVWFSYTPNCSGQVTLSTCGSALANTVLNVYSGPCYGPLVACNDNAAAGPCNGSQQSFLTFNAIAGTNYRIRVGGAGGQTGNGVLNIVGPNPAATTCGTSPINWHLYVVVGPANGNPWAWSISTPCCANLQNLNTTGVFGTSLTAAQQFANSINAQCPGTAIAFQWFGTTFLAIGTRCGPGSPLTLRVGPAGTPVNNLCVVSGTTLPTSGPCSFNPDIFEAELTGRDDNANGRDDLIDIVSGDSADANENLIPDEVETCVAPVVNAKPDSSLIELGADVTLAVSASGTPPLSYQWLLNGVPIAGATGSTLNINPVEATDLGSYSVSISNACGSVEGTSADVFVQPVSLPILVDPELSDGMFHFSVETKIGYNYEVQYKDDLDDPSWTTLTNVPGDGTSQVIFDSAPAPHMRFYRVVRQ